MTLIVCTHSVKSGEPEKFCISNMAKKIAGVPSNGCISQISLLIISCFSGGWAMAPSLNVSVMTATLDEKSINWRKSKSVGRFCGSIYATVVLQALLKMECGAPK